ncbi:response regulator [Pseudemcibacter aquimaris]|uniref:response regulator n=1 Tax=Pseudemcibacter aquimaris TaxID=2857064 RepID=UPI0020129BC5|nr:response regulator [Pseudemcibacter aquimaris]MCC3861220.1 response regulator [Pseudemcibacter aquimaris]WDU57995.1 response regulator [Pseudemcibacter aquimaris]
MKILYVEDVEMNARLLALMVEQIWGYEIDIAETAEQGLEMIEAQKYDLVYMDVNLPNMNGIEAVQEIRKSYSEKDLPIIMVSADVSEEAIIKARGAGANDYMSKPVNLTALKEKSSKYVEMDLMEKSV